MSLGKRVLHGVQSKSSTQSCARCFPPPQLPLVLDKPSIGVDIRLWVRVASATSAKLREVSRGLATAPPPFKSSPGGYFRPTRKQLLPLAPGFLRKHRQWGGSAYEERLNSERASAGLGNRYIIAIAEAIRIKTIPRL